KGHTRLLQDAQPLRRLSRRLCHALPYPDSRGPRHDVHRRGDPAAQIDGSPPLVSNCETPPGGCGGRTTTSDPVLALTERQPSCPHMTRPRLLDIGAGAGRIGWPLVAAGDDYIGVDLSLGMLREFTGRAEWNGAPARLVQADGERLPLADASFDAVLLMQVLSAARDWRKLVAEAGRVLRPAGCLIVGRTIAPDNGIDAR